MIVSTPDRPAASPQASGALARLDTAWRRRYWRPDPAAISAFDGLRPIVVITGASEGIGLALAHRIAADGHDVMLIARRPPLLNAMAFEISARHGVDAIPLPLDITSPDALSQIDAALAAADAYADVLVNSAAIGLSGDFAQHDPADIDRLVALNVAAATRLTRHCLPGMLTRGRGGVLNVASLGAYAPGPFQASYYASKAYLLSLTEALAQECLGQGVRLSAVCPGPVATAFHERMGAASAWYLRLLPMASPRGVAEQAWLGFKLGFRVALPSLVAPLLAVSLRLLPHRMTVPIIAALLRPRR
ncbi:MAG: SDR family oxidoreductase [Hyphomicrobiales bacterium]|nr:SDR family oxidoreductase [Hyphomicrobiales bacterium]